MYLYRVLFTQVALTPLKMSRKTLFSFLVNLRNISELLIFHWLSYFFCINFIILVMSVIFQAITFVFRLEPSVKSSRTVLLHFCYVGINMLNLVSIIHFIKSTFVITSDTVYVALCSISIITGSFGLTLVLGTLTMKTWRLYKIFVHYMNPGKLLSNKTLLLFVCCLTLVDLVICITWFMFDPITRRYKEVSYNNLEGVIM